MVGLVGVVRQFACRWSSRVESESARNLVIAHPRWVGLGLQWIDLEGDGDQRQYKNEEKSSHGSACRARMRQKQLNNSAENGSFIAGVVSDKHPWNGREAMGPPRPRSKPPALPQRRARQDCADHPLGGTVIAAEIRRYG